jgi:hypothetical protein
VGEDEWLAATDPAPMLGSLRVRTSERRLRLFACGCCRALWTRLTVNRSRRAVEWGERYADDPSVGTDQARVHRLAAEAAWEVRSLPDLPEFRSIGLHKSVEDLPIGQKK